MLPRYLRDDKVKELVCLQDCSHSGSRSRECFSICAFEGCRACVGVGLRTLVEGEAGFFWVGHNPCVRRILMEKVADLD